MWNSRVARWLLIASLVAGATAGAGGGGGGSPARAATVAGPATPRSHARAARNAARAQSSERLFEAEPEPARAVSEDPQILSRDEILSLARKYLADIGKDLARGESAREVAARERDSLKVTCIQAHLLDMKLAKKLSDDALDALERPAVRADELSLRHEFRAVEMARERVGVHATRLAECVGESLEVTMTIETEPTNGRGKTPSSTPIYSDPTAPSATVTAAMAPGTQTLIIDRPIDASPIQ